MKFIVNLKQVNLSDTEIVGGKNASTGEMIQHLSRQGIPIAGGFAITVEAYRQFLSQNGLHKKIVDRMMALKNNDITLLNQASADIRRWIIQMPFSAELEREVALAYAKLKNGAVAVRSSATSEDLATASFAGAQETFLNVKGIRPLLKAVKLVYASLFNSRAIAYRHDQGFNHADIALSVGVQPMVRSDQAVSGVAFTLDTESGFDKVIVISASYGLGESIVQGQVNPDEFVIYKPNLLQEKHAILQRRLGDKAIKMVYASPNNAKFIKTVPVKPKDRVRFCISDKDIHTVAHYALAIEKHYGKPMDIEWAKDGAQGKIIILQARPETVKSRSQQDQAIERYTLIKKSKVLAEGQSIGQRIGSGTARIILDPKKSSMIHPGEILVTDMTDPDWEPIMKKSAAIITNRGGRTCHAAIVARELGIPAIVGCTQATTLIKNNQPLTVSCAEGQIGYVYEGLLPFKISNISIKNMPRLPVKLCLNIGNPEKAFTTQFLPNEGVGLARLEFIISQIGIHPNALLQFKKLPKKLKKIIHEKIMSYSSPIEFYIEKLREGIAMIAAAFYPKQVIFRFSDFKTNEYANLLGGDLFEPKEENPMLGFRGASRYKDIRFKSCFELECEAFKRVREQMGLTNAQLMVPFVRTLEELHEVIALIEQYGLKRGRNKLKIYMMCEVPSNALLAEKFLNHVDGFSIGSNDLTQLVLGLDRDSNIVASLFNERNEAIKLLLHKAIQACIKKNKYIGICGQGPSDYPDFAQWLMDEGIENISLNADSIVETWWALAKQIKPKKKN